MKPAQLLLMLASAVALTGFPGPGPGTPPPGETNIAEGIYDICGTKKTVAHDAPGQPAGTTFIEDHLDGATRMRLELLGTAKDKVVSFVRPETEGDKEPLVFGLAAFPDTERGLRTVGSFKHTLGGKNVNILHAVRIHKLEKGSNTMPEGCSGGTVLTISFCDLTEDDSGKKDFLCQGTASHGGDIHVER